MTFQWKIVFAFELVIPSRCFPTFPNVISMSIYFVSWKCRVILSLFTQWKINNNNNLRKDGKILWNTISFFRQTFFNEFLEKKYLRSREYEMKMFKFRRKRKQMWAKEKIYLTYRQTPSILIDWYLKSRITLYSNSVI